MINFFKSFLFFCSIHLLSAAGMAIFLSLIDYKPEIYIFVAAIVMVGVFIFFIFRKKFLKKNIRSQLVFFAASICTFFLVMPLFACPVLGKLACL